MTPLFASHNTCLSHWGQRPPVRPPMWWLMGSSCSPLSPLTAPTQQTPWYPFTHASHSVFLFIARLLPKAINSRKVGIFMFIQVAQCCCYFFLSYSPFISHLPLCPGSQGLSATLPSHDTLGGETTSPLSLLSHIILLPTLLMVVS